jgi:hypothetical protein
MNKVCYVMMAVVVSGAMISLAATDLIPSDRPTAMGTGTNVTGTATNGTNAAWKLSNTNAWKRSADEAATDLNRAADTTRDTLNKAGEATKEAVKDAGRAIERTGETMQ